LWIETKALEIGLEGGQFVSALAYAGSEGWLADAVLALDVAGLVEPLAERSGPGAHRMPCDVRFGSKADIEARPFDVRFTPKSGHSVSPLCRQSAHPRLRKIPFNSFHAGATANPITGIDTAPIDSPTIPDRKAITVHFISPPADGSA
jgi:hypothetical protein